MKKALTVGCSPLTSIIFAGTLLSDSKRWSSNKQDVTGMAVSSVAQHLLQKDECLQFNYEGKCYEMKVVELNK